MACLVQGNSSRVWAVVRTENERLDALIVYDLRSKAKKALGQESSSRRRAMQWRGFVSRCWCRPFTQPFTHERWRQRWRTSARGRACGQRTLEFKRNPAYCSLGKCNSSLHSHGHASRRFSEQLTPTFRPLSVPVLPFSKFIFFFFGILWSGRDIYR